MTDNKSRINEKPKIHTADISLNPTALKKAKTACNFGLLSAIGLQHFFRKCHNNNIFFLYIARIIICFLSLEFIAD